MKHDSHHWGLACCISWATRKVRESDLSHTLYPAWQDVFKEMEGQTQSTATVP